MTVPHAPNAVSSPARSASATPDNSTFGAMPEADMAAHSGAPRLHIHAT
jgi:hypothetical protein